ncbi:PilZ domain-containing protein [Methylobacterium oryzihabitans]|uniref:PilZ domain-containing protein n=1 Tax=Methylobacterium oryzihabitans TaxID=2499852 RepID=A0A3S2VCB0_9HYPH|nr:PilZ domain-containing protein [Methylobacterium oryzihabitans]RVU19431.1 PilZ domain-containing protein [Methylobacterium oryzihabitans]
MSRPPGTQGSAPPRARPDARTPELRAVRRRRVLQQGRIVLGPDRLLACTVSDLSPAGARLLVPGDVALPEHFDLMIAAHDLRRYPARLRWRRGDVAGVTFAPEAPGEDAP